MKKHRSRSDSRGSIHRNNNSSAVRWNDTSAAPDSLATIIRDRTLIVPDEDEDLSLRQDQLDIHGP